MSKVDGELFTDDDIPETLKTILRYQMEEQLPVLIDSNKQLAVWAASSATFNRQESRRRVEQTFSVSCCVLLLLTFNVCL